MSAESLKLGSLVPGGLPAGQGKTLMAGEGVSAQRPEFMPFNATGSGKKIDDRRMENDPVLNFLNQVDVFPPAGDPHAAPWRTSASPELGMKLGYGSIPTDEQQRTLLTGRFEPMAPIEQR